MKLIPTCRHLLDMAENGKRYRYINTELSLQDLYIQLLKIIGQNPEWYPLFSAFGGFRAILYSDSFSSLSVAQAILELMQNFCSQYVQGDDLKPKKNMF